MDDPVDQRFAFDWSLQLLQTFQHISTGTKHRFVTCDFSCNLCSVEDKTDIIQWNFVAADGDDAFQQNDLVNNWIKLIFKMNKNSINCYHDRRHNGNAVNVRCIKIYFIAIFKGINQLAYDPCVNVPINISRFGAFMNLWRQQNYGQSISRQIV